MADESLDGTERLEIIRRAADMFHVKVQGKGGLLQARRHCFGRGAGIPCIIGQISEMSIGATVDATLASARM
jgi:hypothetical protein